ncbi:helix-turn-helix domain-containing protein [Phytoactinopolyspora mesophila]|nr:helix-turn-helix transcriptional regulator [Phytoactinopolyspora mesophila]
MREPAPALAPFVDVLWYVDEPLPPGRERAVPNGSMQIVVNLGADVLRWYDGDGLATMHSTRGSGLCGAIAHPVGIDTADQRASVGVAFRPGGVAPFFHPPADALVEPVIGLDTLWGRDGASLRERLLEQPTPEAMLRTLERLLLARVIRPELMPRLDRFPPPSRRSTPAPRDGMGYAIGALGQGATIGAVVDRLGMTPSTFTRRFRAAVGLNPKPFARIRRLQRVLGGLRGETEQDWAAVAADHGYFDQAHMINEFRALTGVTPGQYRPRAPGEQNHIPLGP